MTWELHTVLQCFSNPRKSGVPSTPGIALPPEPHNRVDFFFLFCFLIVNDLRMLEVTKILSWAAFIHMTRISWVHVGHGLEVWTRLSHTWGG